MKFGSDAPVGSGTSAHVAYSQAGTWAMWAEVLGPGGTSDQNSNRGIQMYLFLLSNSEIYSDSYCKGLP